MTSDPEFKLSTALWVLVASIAIVLAASELGLRVAGYPVWTKIQPFPFKEPSVHEPDPLLGWRNKVGYVEWSKRPDPLPVVGYTMWPGARRATASELRPREQQVVVIGGSLTQGWGLSDAETYPWRLQERLDTVEVVNYGTSGYGTYQSLLSLERHLARSQRAPSVVVYGFTFRHAHRNVASPVWLRQLSQAADLAIAEVPFVSLDEKGKLVRHSPTRYADWPLKRHSALITLLEERIFGAAFGVSFDQQTEVTAEVFRELARVTRASGARLMVAVLEKWGGLYLRVLESEGIEHVDCSHPDMLEQQVPIYGHPNASVNLHWAECIAAALGKVDSLPAQAQ